MSFSGGSDGKASACYAGVLGLIPESGRSSGEGNGNPFHYSCLENSMDGGDWEAIVHGVAKSLTQLSNFYFHWGTKIPHAMWHSQEKKKTRCTKIHRGEKAMC